MLAYSSQKPRRRSLAALSTALTGCSVRLHRVSREPVSQPGSPAPAPRAAGPAAAALGPIARSSSARPPPAPRVTTARV